MESLVVLVFPRHCSGIVLNLLFNDNMPVGSLGLMVVVEVQLDCFESGS